MAAGIDKGSFMFNPEQLLGKLLGGSMSGGLGGKKRRKGGSMLGNMSTGTKAQLGIGLLGVAMAAWDHYKTQPGAAASAGMPPTPGTATARPTAPLQMPPPPPGAPGSMQALPAAPVASAARDQRTHDMVLLIQAMVAAAAADGHIDDIERGQIIQRATDAQLDAETQAFLRAELDAPKSLAAIVSAARPELGIDIYAASCVAISLDTEAERVYLDTLAMRLNLGADTRQTIHAQVGIA